VLDIPVILRDLGKRGDSLLCTQNAIVEDIQQRIPIPRPLAKINGQIIGRFTGTNENQRNHFSEGSTDSNTPTSQTTISSITTMPSVSQTREPSQSVRGQTNVNGEQSVPIFTTIIRTATIQADSKPAQQTVLDESTFGGPGGDLTNIGDDSAFKLFEMFGKQRSGCSRTKHVKFGKLFALGILGYILL
jgi:hypothetical protein